MFSDLVKQVDGFMQKHGQLGTVNDKDKMRSDLLDLIQKSIEHGEAKDQNKISGIVVNGIKAFLGRGKD